MENIKINQPHPKTATPFTLVKVPLSSKSDPGRIALSPFLLKAYVVERASLSPERIAYIEEHIRRDPRVRAQLLLMQTDANALSLTN